MAVPNLRRRVTVDNHAETKLCKACRAQKSVGEFYVISGRWFSSSCRDCTKAAVNAYRAANIEKVREYDRQRGLLPERKAAVKARAPRYADRRKQYTDADNARRPNQRQARIKLGNAINVGKVVKAEVCQSCGAHAHLHGHHHDYAKPLEVVWLCTKCHGAEHRKINTERRARP